MATEAVPIRLRRLWQGATASGSVTVRLGVRARAAPGPGRGPGPGPGCKSESGPGQVTRSNESSLSRRIPCMRLVDRWGSAGSAGAGPGCESRRRLWRRRSSQPVTRTRSKPAPRPARRAAPAGPGVGSASLHKKLKRQCNAACFKFLIFEFWCCLYPAALRSTNCGCQSWQLAGMMEESNC